MTKTTLFLEGFLPSIETFEMNVVSTSAPEQSIFAVHWVKTAVEAKYCLF